MNHSASPIITPWAIYHKTGVEGFEPPVHGFKVRCLTTWPHPSEYQFIVYHYWADCQPGQRSHVLFPGPRVATTRRFRAFGSKWQPRRASRWPKVARQIVIPGGVQVLGAVEFGLRKDSRVPTGVLIFRLRVGYRASVICCGQVIVLGPTAIDVPVAGETRCVVDQQRRQVDKSRDNKVKVVKPAKTAR